VSQSAQRALLLLNRVVCSDRPLGFVEIVGESGLHKSTTARLLSVLRDQDLIARDPATKRYVAGTRFVSIAAVALRKWGLADRAMPVMEELRKLTGETVGLNIRVGQNRACVGGAESHALTRQVLPLGEEIPIWTGPSGTSILAFLPSPEAEAILASATPAPVDWPAKAALIRALGYAMSVGEVAAGVAGIAAPVFGPGGVVGSIGVGAPAQRWTVPLMEQFAPRLLEAVDGLSAAVGGVVPGRL
jgi:DNA-binding IclR family transcriptional regulator